MMPPRRVVVASCSFPLLVLFSTTGFARIDVDTDRPSKIFHGGVRIPGLYADIIKVSQQGEVEMGGNRTHRATDMIMETETEVTNTGVTMEITRFAVTTIRIDGESLSFDTSEPENGDPKYQSLLDLVGTAETTEADELGRVTDSVFDERETPNNDDPRFSPILQYGEVATLLDAVLPRSSVRSGDSWHAGFGMGILGHASGRGTLRGFVAYGGRDCAVFTFEGDVSDVVLPSVMETMGGAEVASMSSVFEMVESSMRATLYWDDDSRFLRWSKVQFRATLGLPNPFDTKSTYSLPIERTLIIDTKLKGS